MQEIIIVGQNFSLP